MQNIIQFYAIDFDQGHFEHIISFAFTQSYMVCIYVISRIVTTLYTILEKRINTKTKKKTKQV